MSKSRFLCVVAAATIFPARLPANKAHSRSKVLAFKAHEFSYKPGGVLHFQFVICEQYLKILSLYHYSHRFINVYDTTRTLCNGNFQLCYYNICMGERVCV